tara:strand:+ start:641 stop:823 length:183 start_codon:yes stop_codon:yes gene_type:complete
MRVTRGTTVNGEDLLVVYRTVGLLSDSYVSALPKCDSMRIRIMYYDWHDICGLCKDSAGQ